MSNIYEVDPSELRRHAEMRRASANERRHQAQPVESWEDLVESCGIIMNPLLLRIHRFTHHQRPDRADHISTAEEQMAELLDATAIANVRTDIAAADAIAAAGSPIARTTVPVDRVDQRDPLAGR